MSIAMQLHALNHAINSEFGTSIARGSVNLLHNLTIKVNLNKEGIEPSAKAIADELRERNIIHNGVKLAPDFTGRHNYKVYIAS